MEHDNLNEDTRFCRLYAVVSSSSLTYKKKVIEITRLKPAMNKDGSSVIKCTEKPFDLYRNQPSDQPKQIFNFFFLLKYYVAVISNIDLFDI